jgi:hypothetical protein
MTAPQTVQSHPASVDAYIRHGWSLVPIPANTKGPRTPGWNLKQNALKAQGDLPPGYGIGLAHAYSGTMALDIDNWTVTTSLLADHGLDLDALYAAPDAVVINSGKPGHGKLLYAMPFGAALPSKKIMHGGITAYELRCATVSGLTVQDVLPPSIHPETLQPYHWAGHGHWTRLPIIPQGLLDLWGGLLAQDKERTIATDGTIDASWEEIRQALDAVPAECTRDEWVGIGMALHWAGTQTDQLEQALSLWNEWSATAQTKYPGEREILTQWISFKPDKATAVKLGTLFHIAKSHGWSRPMPDASELFSAVEAPTVTPDQLLDGFRISAPDVNMDLFPTVLRDRALQIGSEMGSDPLVPLFAGLAAVCGAIDARSRLELMPRYQVPPVLWVMTIGKPSLKKSPASKPMFTTLRYLEMEDTPRYSKAALEWEGKEAAYNSAKKSFLEWSASPDAMLGGDLAPSVPDLAQRPAPLKIVTSDVTSQKLVRDAADNPRGMLCVLDEMNGWIGKMTDRSSGDDRSAWVVAYEADYYKMDRVGAGSILAENFAVGIYGNVQPQVFRENSRSLAADGLLQRFIPVMLRDRNWGVGQPLPDFMVNTAAWDSVMRLAYSLPAQVYKLSPEAFAIYREFQYWYNEKMQDEVLLHSGPVFMTAFGKLEGTVGRLMLLWHVIESPFGTLVSGDVAQRVVEFAKTYLVPAYRYAFDEGMGREFDKWLTEHIVQHATQGKITLSEIKKSARRQWPDSLSDWAKDQLVMDTMGDLEQARYVIRTDDGSKVHRHIAEWAINPAILTTFGEQRKAILRAKQRQRDEIYALSPKERKLVKGYTPDMDE